MSIVNERHIQGGNMAVSLLETGDIRTIEAEGILLNQLIGNPLDGMAANIYLRVYSADGSITAYPMIGKGKGFAVSANAARYTGEASGIGYTVTLTPAENAVFWTVTLTGSGKDVRADVLYTQDVGLGAMGHVMANEAYNAQYIDYKVFDTEAGKVVCARQNQGQHTGYPFLQQGSFSEVASFSVDGFPFFGLDYKFDNVAKELTAPTLNNRLYQYEFAFTALQLTPFTVKAGMTATHIFYAAFQKHVDAPMTAPLALDNIRTRYDMLAVDSRFETVAPFTRAADGQSTLCSLPMAEDELATLYPVAERRHTETDDNGSTRSFFTREGRHIVTMAKEHVVERPHGNIIQTGENDPIREDILASVQYIYGVFNSKIVVGNTSFNKLMTNTRNALNVMKASGQRVMVQYNGVWRVLTMPAVFEMGLNFGKWLYKLDNGDTLEVISFVRTKTPTLRMTVRSLQGKAYNFMLYSQVCGTPDDYTAMPVITRNGRDVSLTHAAGTMTKNVYPHLEFVFHMDEDFTMLDDSAFYPDMGTQGEPLLVMAYDNVSRFGYTLEGRVDGKPVLDSGISFEEEAVAYAKWLHGTLNNLHLHLPKDNEWAARVDRLNDLALWYAHNARIHYAMPMGLEQFGGGAWGTRDVCQGPMELFLALQNFASARDTLLRVYNRQFFETGDWPQWFMFDKYKNIMAGESHGDVIVWPLKALAHYLRTAEDASILAESVGYRSRMTGDTDVTETVFAHVKRQVAHIEAAFIPGTSLSRYGDGDWDDTLQPHDPTLREKMVSGWTVALTYQAFTELGTALLDIDAAYGQKLIDLAVRMSDEFHALLMADGMTAGFAVFEDGGSVKYLLHPRDAETGLNARLLPMTRSMIGGLFTKDETDTHMAIIRGKMTHTDGVRLMDTTCRYDGGKNTYFKRAETAANFGREIGLQYIHAHIRFIEAMAKTGRADDAWRGLFQICPIHREDMVPNAVPGQANCYFSSSDGMFDNRYEAMRDFGKLRAGEVGVKTGWRIYSSGSGIYLNQLIANCLGIRMAGDMVELDPVLPEELDGLTVKTRITGKAVILIYHVSAGYGVSRVAVNGQDAAFEALSNPYRNGGALVDATAFTEGCKVEVWV